MGSNKALAFIITSAISALLSIMGSIAIIYNVLHRNPRTRLSTTYHRIMFVMSIMDIIGSFGGSFSTLPAPSDTLGVYAFGNTATCTTQGLFIALNSSVVFYNFSLTVHYLLVICFDFTVRRMRKQVEPFFHLVSFGYPLCTSLLGLYLEVYNFAGNRCWIAPYPTGCSDNDAKECTRGIHAPFYRWISMGYILTFSMVALPIMMMFIIWTVWSREYKMRKKYSNAPTDQGNHSMWVYSWCCPKGSISRPRDEYDVSQERVFTRTKAVTVQCTLYMLAFMLTYIWPYTQRLVENRRGQSPSYLQLLTSIFYPLQGFLNYLVFMKRQVMRLRHHYPEYSLLQAFSEATFHPARCELKTSKHYLTRLSTNNQNKMKSSMHIEVDDTKKMSNANGNFEGINNFVQEKDLDNVSLDENVENESSEPQHMTSEDNIESQLHPIKCKNQELDDIQLDMANIESGIDQHLFTEDCSGKDEVIFETVEGRRALKIEDFDVTTDE